MADLDKWSDFQSDAYEITNLGRPAVFLIPSHKLQMLMGDLTVEKRLHAFLVSNFGAFTTTLVPYFGYWRDRGARLIHDECRLYEVSFNGKEHIPPLLTELATIAKAIGEDCIYVKAGQYTCLIRPK